MRVMHVVGFLADNGCGIVNAAVDVALGQAKLGHEVAVVSAGGEHERLLERFGVRHFRLVHWKQPLTLLRAFFLFRRQLREFKPDIVHVHMRTGLLLAWLWSRLYRFLIVAHVHNVYDRESAVMGLADRVIVVSQSSAAMMKTRGTPAKKLRVVLNRTLNSPRQPALSQLRPAPLEGRAIVTVGGLTHRKGIAELLSAFELVAEQFSTAHLYLVGEGSERELFETQARASRWPERIHFEGFQGLPQAYMMSADVFVLASRRESFPLVLIEARQAGCAIVATDVDGNSEALDGGRAGVLTLVEDAVALASALSRLLANDDERDRFKAQALIGIDAYGVDAMAREVDAIYRELVRLPASRELSEAAMQREVSTVAKGD